LQVRAQLRGLKDALMGVAETEAETRGMAGKDFLAAAERANTYFKENVLPIQSLVGRASPRDIASGKDKAGRVAYTNAWFFDKVSKALEANDVEKLRGLMAAIGPRAKEGMARVVDWEMLHTKSGAPRATTGIVKYVEQRSETLRELLGREKVEELLGGAKIAQRLGKSTFEQHRGLWTWGTRSALPFIGGERIVEGLMHGDTHRIMQGVGLFAAPFAVHAIMKVLQKLRDTTYMLPLLRKAARLKPDSPELDKAIRQVEIRLGVGAITMEMEGQGELRGSSASP